MKAILFVETKAHNIIRAEQVFETMALSQSKLFLLEIPKYVLFAMNISKNEEHQRVVAGLKFSNR
jgi:hypothetical protein